MAVATQKTFYSYLPEDCQHCGSCGLSVVKAKQKGHGCCVSMSGIKFQRWGSSVGFRKGFQAVLWRANAQSDSYLQPGIANSTLSRAYLCAHVRPSRSVLTLLCGFRRRRLCHGLSKVLVLALLAVLRAMVSPIFLPGDLNHLPTTWQTSGPSLHVAQRPTSSLP